MRSVAFPWAQIPFGVIQGSLRLYLISPKVWPFSMHPQPTGIASANAFDRGKLGSGVESIPGLSDAYPLWVDLWNSMKQWYVHLQSEETTKTQRYLAARPKSLSLTQILHFFSSLLVTYFSIFAAGATLFA